jgi:MinD-like ATPase involved in chromosome partitioning or flagellar assembly
MSVVAFTGLHGSPGATTLAVAVAHRWATAAGRDPLLVEADPDGGVIAARHQIGLIPGLTELAGSARVGIDAADIVERAQRFPSGIAVVPAHPSSDRTQAALRAAAGHLAQAFAGIVDADVLLDVGRIRPGSPALPLLETVDRLVVVVRPIAELLVVTMNRLEMLTQLAPIEVVAVGTKPYGPADVARALGLDEVTIVPDDASAVQSDPAAAKPGRKGWSASVSTLVSRLASRADASEAAAA